jgi:sugar lactone lactonase YvrE
MTLTPVTSSAAGTPGQSTTYQVTLTNTSRWASSFDLFVDDHSWATSLSTTTTAVVQPGQSTTFSVTVTPTAGVFNAQDQVLLSARSGHDGHTRQFTYLTTSTGEGTEFLAASSENMALVTIDTAGNHWSYPGTLSGLLNPTDVKFDADGNCYVADTATNRVVKFDSVGQSTILSNGSGIVFPTALAIDDVGNVYVSSHFNQKIIVIAPNGTSSVLADQTSGLTNPFGLTLDGAGNLYVASVEGQKVFKIDAQGIVSVFADTSDGLLAPIDVKIDAEGNIFVADVLQQKVFEFSPDGIGTIFADIGDGLGSPSGLMFDHAGNLFVSNYLFDTIVKLSPDGVGTIVATAADGIDGVFGLAETIQSLSSFANLALSTQAVPELGALPLCFSVVLMVGLRLKLRWGRKAQKPV